MKSAIEVMRQRRAMRIILRSTSQPPSPASGPGRSAGTTGRRWRRGRRCRSAGPGGAVHAHRQRVDPGVADHAAPFGVGAPVGPGATANSASRWKANGAPPAGRDSWPWPVIRRRLGSTDTAQRSRRSPSPRHQRRRTAPTARQREQPAGNSGLAGPTARPSSGKSNWQPAGDGQRRTEAVAQGCFMALGPSAGQRVELEALVAHHSRGSAVDDASASCSGSRSSAPGPRAAPGCPRRPRLPALAQLVRQAQGPSGSAALSRSRASASMRPR